MHYNILDELQKKASFEASIEDKKQHQHLESEVSNSNSLAEFPHCARKLKNLPIKEGNYPHCFENGGRGYFELINFQGWRLTDNLCHYCSKMILKSLQIPFLAGVLRITEMHGAHYAWRWRNWRNKISPKCSSECIAPASEKMNLKPTRLSRCHHEEMNKTALRSGQRRRQSRGETERTLGTNFTI